MSASIFGGENITGLVVEYIVAIDVTQLRFSADAYAAYDIPQPGMMYDV